MTYTCVSIGCIRPVNNRHDFCKKCIQKLDDAVEEAAERLKKVEQTKDQLDTVPKVQAFLEQVVKSNKDTNVVNPLATQVGGNHYKNLAIQPVEYIHANGIGYFEGNVIKYVSRWQNKNGLADLEKAKHYLELLIELQKRKVEPA